MKPTINTVSTCHSSSRPVTYDGVLHYMAQQEEQATTNSMTTTQHWIQRCLSISESDAVFSKEGKEKLKLNITHHYTHVQCKRIGNPTP